MLSIGEFSNICKVSTKTLRYYAEVGLILPAEINPENGYRYYAIDQLETMLFINRLKSYNFSLEEIKEILDSGELADEKLCSQLVKKEKEMKAQARELQKSLDQLKADLLNLRQGRSMMSYLKTIDVKLVDVMPLRLFFIRKMVQQGAFEDEYKNCFGKLLKKVASDGLTITAPPMVLFHGAEFTPSGLDTEFAIPVKEQADGTRDFSPGLCLKTVLHGPYSDLPSVYAKQYEWAEREGYQCSSALYEVYVTDPSQVADDNQLITEVYYPVKKKVE